MARRRTLQILLSILALFLVGTVVVLSSISFYLAIDNAAYLTEEEVGPVLNGTRWNATEHGKVERIPRILHQTWKTEVLPDRWKDISQECRDMMPDYNYTLWTDISSREFIAKEYSWFLNTFDAYTYPIQRADAIRYFVLHHFGGVYLDLDVGCRRPLDSLLVYPVILPRTIPVGVSNDLMFAEKGHPFMAQTIHNLITFDHSWVLNYPTVMFSTGPMFLSAQYGIWTSSHPPTADTPGGEVRILPKPLYGKNAKPEEAPHAFFSHFYGSSWHADDAAFIGFLGKWGKGLMWVGLGILIIGIGRLLWQKKNKRDRTGRVGGYEILLPRSYQRNGRWHIDLGLFTTAAPGSATGSPPSPVSPSGSHASHTDEESLPILPIPFDVRPPSPSASESSSGESMGTRAPRRSSTIETIRRAGNRVITSITGGRSRDHSRGRSLSRRNRGVLFFLPAIFTPTGSYPVELGSRRNSGVRSSSRATAPAPPAPYYAPEKQPHESDLEDVDMFVASSSAQPSTSRSSRQPPAPRPTSPSSSVHTPILYAAPPPYPDAEHASTPTSSWSAEARWEEWESR